MPRAALRWSAACSQRASGYLAALVCANDQTALGAMYALAQHGIDVPGEVAVTGFDDIPVARHLRPQLTTIRQPIADLGATAFEVLRSMIGSQEQAGHDIVLPTRLLRRQSCGCQPAAGSGIARLRASGLFRGRPMMRLLARRITLYLVTAVVAITVNFFIPRLMPGNPVEAAIAHMQARVTPATIRALDVQYGLNTKLGLWGQYLHYWGQLSHGNLGISFSSYPSTVTSVIRSALPWTIGLVGLATVISFAASARCSASSSPGAAAAGWTTCSRRRRSSRPRRTSSSRS